MEIRSLHRWSAKCESVLSSYGFTILFLVSYINALLLMFFWGAHEEYVHTKTPILRWYISIARGFGYTLNLNCGLLIFLASRLVFTLVRETPLNLVVPFDKSFPAFHVIVAYITFASAVSHALFHLIWIIEWGQWGDGLWGISMCVSSGIILLVVSTLIVISSLPSIRRTKFQIFYSLHNLFAVLFFTLLLLHGVYRGKPYTYKWIVPPLIIYTMDRIVRRVKTGNSSIWLYSKNSYLCGTNILKLQLPKQFKYRAGQYAEVKVNSIHNYEWHPFTIASAPFEKTMCFYIKAVGDWTRALRQTFETRIQDGSESSLRVQIRGPYGAPAQHVGGYQRVVLIAGGVGSTPFCSVCKDIFHKMDHEIEQEVTSDEEIRASKKFRKVERELMSCIAELYNEAMEDIEEENVESDRESKPYSLGALFAITNEFGDGGSVAEPSMRKIVGRINDLKNLQCRNPDSPSTGAKLPLSYPCNHFESREIMASRSVFCMNDTECNTIVGSKLQLNRWEKWLSSLHTISVNMSLYMIMLLRVVVLAYASIFDSMPTMSSSSQTSVLYDNMWITWCDSLLGLLILLVTSATLCIELLVYRKSFFKSKGSLTDALLLIPVSALSVCLGISAIIGRSNGFFLPTYIHFGVILPLLMVLLLVRLHRVIGSRVLLADSYSHSDYKIIRAIDFIWTTPYDDDDDWLREELAPLADGASLSLHRYVTREKQDVERGTGAGKDRGMAGVSTNFGRPEWEGVLKQIAEGTPTNGKVGVFFCGPKGMSKAIRKAIMKVQVLTNLRGTYLGTIQRTSVSSSGMNAMDYGDLERLKARGSNIRFVFREENFG